MAFVAFFALPLFAQSGIDADSTVHIVLPKSFDFSSISNAYSSAATIISAALTLFLGYFAKSWKWLATFASTPSRRVTIVGVLSSVIVLLVFGFSKDAISLAWSVILGVLSGQVAYDKVLKTEETKTPVTE